MLKTKLLSAKIAYEMEFDALCKQFELIGEDVRELKEDKNVLNQRIMELEGIITEQNNFIETTGYKLRKRDDDAQPQTLEEQEGLDELERIEMMQQVPKKAAKQITQAKGVLDQVFSFYSFSVELNKENSNHIMNSVYNRLLEKRIVEEHMASTMINSELASSRKMTKGF